MKSHIPFKVRPMLATLIAEPFHKPSWVYEEKYDGYRLIAYKDGDWVMLLSRRQRQDRCVRRNLGGDSEVACSHFSAGRGGCSFRSQRDIAFQLLQQGGRSLRFAVFDCLYVNGRDIRKEPLKARRPMMEGAIS